MYQDHSAFEKPENENVKIWRFVDFAKFVDMLHNKAIFFCRANLLGDPFEGKYTNFMIETFIKNAKNLDDKKMFEKFFVNSANEFIRTMFISCWYTGDVEPYGMWKSYTRSNQAVVIQSTFKKFIESFHKSGFSVFCGKVKYRDYDKDMIPYDNAFHPLMYKRNNFQHESELRAIVTNFDLLSGNKEYPTGYNVPVDLGVLIEEIRTAPQSESWFKKLVTATVTKYGLDKPIVDSSLDANPLSA